MFSLTLPKRSSTFAAMLNFRFLSAFLLACASVAPLFAAAPFARQLDASFDALEANGRMHGGVAVARNGVVVYQRAMGMRAQRDGKPVAADANTMYRVGSIAKVFTAVMIYQLIDEKKLSLDTKLSAFFPAMPNAERITIAHLLAHTSGLASPPQDPGWIYEPQTRQQMLERVAKLKPEYEPGEKSTYSNAGFILLGYIIEDVTKSTYAAQLERRINKRLGLKRTRFGGAIDTARNEAQSFTYDEGKWSPHRQEDLSIAGGSGAIVSTPTELAIFISALFDNRLTSAQRVTDMLTPFSDRLPGSEKGIAVFQLRDSTRSAYQHLGGIDAFFASLTYVPDEKVAMAIVFNGQNYPMGKVFYSVVDAVAGRTLQVPSFQPIELTPETLARYEGVYAFPEIGMSITVKREGKQLSAQASGQDAFPIHAIGETLFSHPPSGILIEFQKDGQFTLYQGRSQMRFRKEAAANQ